MNLNNINKYLHTTYFKIKEYINEYSYLKFIIISLLFVLIIGLFGFYLGVLNSDKAYSINKFEKALVKNDSRAALKYLSFKDNEINLTKDNLQPFLDYINTSPERRKNLINYLNSNESLKEGNMVILKTVGNWPFKKWKIELQPVYLSFSTEFKNTELYLNNILFDKSDTDGYSNKLGPIIPGKYSIATVLTNEYGSSKAEKEIQLLSGLIAVSLSPPAAMVNLQGNYPEAEVYINDKPTSIKIKDFKNIGPIPINNTFTVHAEMSFPWGKTISEKKTFSQLPELRLDINPLTDELRATLEQVYTEFYQSFFIALNQNDVSLIKHSSPEVSQSVFNRYKNTALILKDSYKMKSIQWEQNAIGVKTQNTVYKANAVINLEFDKQKNIFGFPFLTKPESLSLQTILSYDEKNNRWFVSEVNEISK